MFRCGPVSDQAAYLDSAYFPAKVQPFDRIIRRGGLPAERIGSRFAASQKG